MALTIAFVTNNYTPYHGGVVTSITAYAQSLRQFGHHVTIVTLDFRGSREENDVIRVYCPLKFLYKFGPVAVPWQATKEICTIFEQIKPDIVHIHHPFLLGYAALALCQKYTIPTVFTNHTQYDNCLHYVPFPARILRPLVQYRLKNFCQAIDHIIAPSSFVQQKLRAQGVTRPISVLPSPVLPMFANTMPHFVPKKPHTVLQLLFVGRFTIEKNIFTLIQLIKELPEHQFSLTIVGYGHLEKKLRSYANNLLGVYNNQITFVINPDKLQLCALYQAADLFVFASITETNPLVFAEALSCGTPIIALKNAWHSDQLVDNFNGFWAENRTHMKQLVIHIAHNRDLFEQLQYGAWQTSSYFHAKHLGKELEKIYYQLVKY